MKSIRNSLWAGLCLAVLLPAGAQQATAPAAGAVTPGTYKTFAETEMNFSVTLQKDGKAAFTWHFMGDVDKARGTWEQQGSRVTIKTKGRKRSEDAIYVFDYRPELKSPSSLYAGCKKFPEGLLPININNGNKNFSKTEFEGFYAWPEKQISDKNGPCLSKG